jgi:DNA-binding transcriptional ArsR family regulator
MDTDSLSTTFAALADPTRRAILARLAQGSATVKELSVPFSMSGPAISKHLRVLERAGLISQGREAQWRPCQLEVAPLKAVADWTESYRRFWEESFDRLEEYLGQLQNRASGSGDDRVLAAPQGRRVKRTVLAAERTKLERTQNESKGTKRVRRQRK